jgi:hypothetical protein
MIQILHFIGFLLVNIVLKLFIFHFFFTFALEIKSKSYPNTVI